MGHLTVRQLTNRDSDFYTLMGPYLSRRAIVKEIGYPIWDDDDKVWFVALKDRGLVGFAAISLDGNIGVLKSAYVRPEHRKQGIYRVLLQSRIEYARERGCSQLRATATKLSAQALAEAGFVEARRSKNYQWMELSLYGLPKAP